MTTDQDQEDETFPFAQDVSATPPNITPAAQVDTPDARTAPPHTTVTTPAETPDFRRGNKVLVHYNKRTFLDGVVLKVSRTSKDMTVRISNSETYHGGEIYKVKNRFSPGEVKHRHIDNHETKRYDLRRISRKRKNAQRPVGTWCK